MIEVNGKLGISVEEFDLFVTDVELLIYFFKSIIYESNFGIYIALNIIKKRRIMARIMSII